MFRYYDTLVYPDQKDLETATKKEGQSTLGKVMEFFRTKYPNLQVKMQEIIPIDNVLRNISLHAHLIQYQIIIANKSFDVHSSTVNQISKTIVSIYSQIYERCFQVVYHWKIDYPKIPLENTQQVGFN